MLKVLVLVLNILVAAGDTAEDAGSGISPDTGGPPDPPPPAGPADPSPPEGKECSSCAGGYAGLTVVIVLLLLVIVGLLIYIYKLQYGTEQKTQKKCKQK